jgi:hypothetical protein
MIDVLINSVKKTTLLDNKVLKLFIYWVKRIDRLDDFINLFIFLFVQALLQGLKLLLGKPAGIFAIIGCWSCQDIIIITLKLSLPLKLWLLLRS